MNTDEPVKKSTFVTVIAWILIVLTGFGSFITALQNIMIRIMFDDTMKEEMKTAQSEVGMEMPSFFSAMFDNFEMIFFAFFLFTLITFIASIGLLKRKNWARIIIIGIMGLGICWNIGGFYLQQSMMSEMKQMQTKVFDEAHTKKAEQQAARPDDEECCENDPCCDEETTAQTNKHRAQLEEFDKNFQQMQQVMFWVTLFIAFIITVIQVVIIWKLCTRKIVMEFKNA